MSTTFSPATYRERIAEAVQYVQKQSRTVPQIGIVLGSGLGDLADEVQSTARLSYANIPNFPVSTVPGHAGVLVMGTLANKNVAVMRGRVHYYEGYSMQEVTFPVRLLAGLGCKIMIVTNASGGIRRDLVPGDFTIITDHINLMGANPLRGLDDSWGSRFVDMTRAYDPDLRHLAREVGEKIGTPLKEGVFCAVPGPSYETRAEIRLMETAGGDLVGMSTVPETIVARHAGMRVLGISCVMNVVYGVVEGVSHEEVLQVAEQSRPRFLSFMKALVEALPAQ